MIQVYSIGGEVVAKFVPKLGPARTPVSLWYIDLMKCRLSTTTHPEKN